jgi:hypothetical protein
VTGSNFLLTGALTDSQIARLVVQVQNTIGVSTTELASRIGRPAALIEAWEAAEARPSDADLNALAGQCGVTGEALVLRVQAFTIDRAMGILHVGHSTAYVDPAQGNDHVLETYVGLVRNMRMLADDGPVELRSHDLDVLADYLDLDDKELVEQLARAAQVSHADAMELRRQLMRRPILASVAGLLAGGLATLGIAGRAVNDHPVESASAAPAASASVAPTSPTSVSVVTNSFPSPHTIVTTSTPSPPPTTAAAPTTTPATTTAPQASIAKRAKATKTTAAPKDAVIADAESVTNPDVATPLPTTQS